MWTTVGSESDDDNAETQPRRSRSHERKRRRRHASSSPSSSSESDSSSSSSDSDARHRKKRRSKHKKKDRKKSKDKKRKTTKKKTKKSHAVNQNEYGKHGILRESDFHTKAQSFQAWLRDIKKVTEFNGPKWEAMEYFKEYMEDYNTATMPHEKYYDIEKYEMGKYEKDQKKKARKHLEAAGSSRGGSEVPDEDAVRRERQAQRAAKEQEEFRLIMQTMDKDKIEAMRRQEQLRAEMQMHYKAGNVEEARRLEQLLRAEEK
ncbi:hypothetical protein Poli38472_004289 [Pythium oligandrum]|uniref:ADP-ribosylation factor-like protein 6-interacting protein 4 n=1 Tax=Pythium oligandrum TaxID=41045 RepID=A0A8K1FMQ5_PYTOL|nr:hypothetical protein Poli38472_004289 [Pythium oligandrum]|eukprot:TMW66524.1 hypothetical protein Poli38472_004289 [Pythium oligandrum]